jgi:rubrerythrin
MNKTMKSMKEVLARWAEDEGKDQVANLFRAASNEKWRGEAAWDFSAAEQFPELASQLRETPHDIVQYDPYYMCSVCSYIAEGQRPNRCAHCGSKALYEV